MPKPRIDKVQRKKKKRRIKEKINEDVQDKLTVSMHKKYTVDTLILFVNF